jgi:hypothetical protein
MLDLRIRDGTSRTLNANVSDEGAMRAMRGPRESYERAMREPREGHGRSMREPYERAMREP